MKYSDFKEKKTHGSPDFPIQYYYVDETHPQYVMDRHWHREFEIIRVKKGRLNLYLNNMEYIARAGDIFFVGSGILHRGDPENCIYECLVFDLNMLRRHGSSKTTEYILPLIIGDIEIERHLEPSSGMLCSTVSALFGCMKERKPYFELEVYGLISKIIFLLYSENRINLPESNKRVNHQREVITTLVEWIEENYTEKITLFDLAKVANINSKYLCRLFKEFTGHTPTDYINRMRIEKACIDMTVNGKSVTEAALYNGFNDLSYFSKLFKRYKGMNPREYSKSF